MHQESFKKDLWLFLAVRGMQRGVVRLGVGSPEKCTIECLQGLSSRPPLRSGPAEVG